MENKDTKRIISLSLVTMHALKNHFRTCVLRVSKCEIVLAPYQKRFATFSL